MNSIPMEQNFFLNYRLETTTPPYISILINAPHYFLEYAIIIIKDNHYRMMVIKKNSVIFNKKYNSIRGAKIAFSKIFGYNRFKQDQNPQWSHLYPPDEDWLMERFKLPKNVN